MRWDECFETSLFIELIQVIGVWKYRPSPEHVTVTHPLLPHQIWLELQEAQKAKLDEATYNQLLDLRPHLDLETMVS